MSINALVYHDTNMDIQILCDLKLLLVQSGFADNIGMTSVTLPFWVSSCFFPFLFNSLDFRYQLLLCGKI